MSDIGEQNLAAAKAARKEERRKRKAAEAQAAGVEVTVEADGELEPKHSKKEKKRKHANEVEDTEETPLEESGNVEPVPKNKSKKKGSEEIVVESTGDDPMKGTVVATTLEALPEKTEAAEERPKKKRKQADEPVPEPKKSKPPRAEPRKKNRIKAVQSQAELVAPVQLLKKSKKRSTIPGIPDPEDDTLLSEQARKALSYAYTQFSDPSDWKFNKAKQNWLLRNWWSKESIPEKHLPLLTKYVSNVKGGVRENLIKACNAALAPPRPPTPPPQPEEGAQAEIVPLKSALKPTPVVPAPVSPEKPVDMEVKKARARVLLETLADSVTVAVKGSDSSDSE